MGSMKAWGGLALAFVAACGGGGTTGSNTTPPVTGGNPGLPSGTPSASAAVEVINNEFDPNSVLIQVGGTVTWHWTGSGHSVTSYGTPSFSPNAPVSGTGTVLGPVTFNATGDYQYLCSVHGVATYGSTGGMAGVVYVR